MASNPAVSNVHEVGRADIEIIERRRAKDDFGLLMPNGFRINGVEIPIPQDARIKINDITSDEAVTVTVTLLASSVTIRTEPDNRPAPVDKSAMHHIGLPQWCCSGAFQTLGREHDSGCERAPSP